MIHNLQQTIETLKVEKKSMKMKLSDLESLFKSSNNEKDRQLAQYQEEIQQLQEKLRGENLQSGKVLSGLPALKEQLRALMSQCQDFEMHLDKVQEVTEKPAVELKPVTKQAVEVCMHASVRDKHILSFLILLLYKFPYFGDGNSRHRKSVHESVSQF